MKTKLDTQEKLLLLQVLMTDIRMSWDVTRLKRQQDERVDVCLMLIDELDEIANDSNHLKHNLVYCIDWFKFYQSIGVYLAGRHEGRYLRMSICNGGYEGLEHFHQLEFSPKNRSEEFLKITNRLLRSEYVEFPKS